MKKFIRQLILILFCSLLVNFAIGQNEHGVLSEAIKQGNLETLTSAFNESIDLSILGVDAVYSRSQAQMVLRRFFKNNEPREFVIQHQGRSSKDQRYVIGELSTKLKKYKITYFMQSKDDTIGIRKFRIEDQ